jgi:NADP-dependent 3-hydroxy acid dehydrogenase YdfG
VDDAGQRVAVVTGAGSGVGRAAAVALAEAGMSVVLAGRRADRLAETAALISAEGVLTVVADVTDELSVQSLFASAVLRFGRIDVLFNNAGAGAPAARIDQVSLSDWQAVVDVNLTGVFLCAREAFRQMAAQDPPGGRIINNGSISAHVPRPQAAAYTATKHAVTGLTRQIALDGRGCGITCGQIDIGNAASDMTARMGEGALQADGSLRPEPTMDVSAVARSVVLMATLPHDANVLELTVMASAMPYVGRG